MAFERFAAQTLLSISALLGVSSAPDPAGTGWSVSRPWSEDGGRMAFEAKSSDAIDACRAHPGRALHFPMVIQGVHTVSVDGRQIASSGDPSFRTTRSFYGRLTVPCSLVAQGRELEWRVDSFTKYFARIDRFPTAEPGWSAHNLFAETVHVIGAGGMLALALFTLVVFTGKVGLPLSLSVSGSCLGASVYFASVCSGYFGLEWTMLAAHRVADVGVWAAIILLFNSLRLEGLVPRAYFAFYAATVAAGVAIILAGRDGDAIQLGTSFPFAPVLPLLFALLWRVLRAGSGHSGGHPGAREPWTRRRVLHALTLTSFIGACFNEMLVVVGVVNSAPMLPAGFLSGITFFAFALNARIDEAYRERDYLRGNLEAEVARKTKELQAAMHKLRSTQAELVQSAKLASLGTLSAGIAHEINNSLNYVNGALAPLEKLVERSAKPEDRAKIDRLVAVMKEGLQLTLEIIKSLRSHAGLNQAKFNDVRLKEAVASSLAILRSRTRNRIDVESTLPEGLVAFGSVVGLNQVFMNLISNAVDAMPSGGRLTIEGEAVDGKWAVVRVRDTGTGMPPDVAARIFEPFFTTKEVGKGTGLGLHIVRSEVERHGGEIAVESAPGAGTCFTIRLPIQNERLAAANEAAEARADAMADAALAAPSGRAA